MQSQGGQGKTPVCGPLLAQQDLVLKAWAPGISHSQANSSEEGLTLPGEGHNLAPMPRYLEPLCWSLDATWRKFRDLSPAVVNTILQARTPLYEVDV